MRTAYVLRLGMTLVSWYCYTVFGDAPPGWERISDTIFNEIDTSISPRKNSYSYGSGPIWYDAQAGNLYLSANNGAGKASTPSMLLVTEDGGMTWRVIESAKSGEHWSGFTMCGDLLTGRFACFTKLGTSVWSADSGKTVQIIPRYDGKTTGFVDGFSWGSAWWDDQPLQYIIGKKHHSTGTLYYTSNGGTSYSIANRDSRISGMAGPGVIVIGDNGPHPCASVDEFDAFGIFRSVDGGETFTKVSDYTLLGKYPVQRGDTIYWTSTAGILVSTNHGASFTVLGVEEYGTNDTTVQFGPYFGPDPATMLVVGRNGVLKTTNGGDSWTKIEDFPIFTEGNGRGKYNADRGLQTFGWDYKNNVLYATTIGAHVYKKQLESTNTDPVGHPSRKASFGRSLKGQANRPTRYDPLGRAIDPERWERMQRRGRLNIVVGR